MGTPETNRQGLSGSDPNHTPSRFLHPDYSVRVMGSVIEGTGIILADPIDERLNNKIQQIHTNSQTEVRRIAEESLRAQEIGSLPMIDTTQIEEVSEENSLTLS